MTRKLLLIILYLTISYSGFSQKTDSNSIKIEEFKYAINKQFTKITTGTAFSNLGNFASVSSDSKSFIIGGNIIKNQSIWGVELSGGATEGIFKLFNNEKLNTTFSGELKYHRLIKTDFGARNTFDVMEIDDQIDKLKIQFSKDSIALLNNKELYDIQQEIAKSNVNHNKLIKQSKELETIIEDTSLDITKRDSLKAVIGLIKYEIENHKFNEKKLGIQLNKIEANQEEYFEEELEKKEQLKDKKVNELIKKRKNIELEGFDITWISFGLKAKNNSFKLFEPNNIPDTQFKNEEFVSQRLAASISRYRSTSYQGQDVYWSTGFFMDYTTNFDLLKKVEIEERTPVSGNNQQDIIKTINAYQGDYEEGIFEFTAFYDYYRFLGQFNSILGIHINPSLNYSSVIKKPLTNILVGIVVPFGDKDKETSKINVEIFYNRQDVFNYLDKEIKTSYFGIRVTLPITISNYKL